MACPTIFFALGGDESFGAPFSATGRRARWRHPLRAVVFRSGSHVIVVKDTPSSNGTRSVDVVLFATSGATDPVKLGPSAPTASSDRTASLTGNRAIELHVRPRNSFAYLQ